MGGHLAPAIVGRAQELIVNVGRPSAFPTFASDADSALAQAYRLLVEGGAVETEQIALSPYIESRSCHIDHRSSLTERSE